MSGSLCSRRAEEEFQPQEEFELHPWISRDRAARHVGQQGGRLPLARRARHDSLRDLGHALRPLDPPSRRQTTGESIYELVQGQIVEVACPRALRTWFPYGVALPLHLGVEHRRLHTAPLSDEHFELGRPALDVGDLRRDCQSERVTRPRAHHVRRHARGIRHNGVRRYFKSWDPEGAPKPLLG